MTAVVVELAPTRVVAAPMDPDEVTVIEDVETHTADAQPGCGDDNPYQ
ncbi:hypothetical protein [Streptomyces sp. NPDC045470]